MRGIIVKRTIFITTLAHIENLGLGVQNHHPD